MQRVTRVCRQAGMSQGSILSHDFPNARRLTISCEAALNAIDVVMVKQLRQFYLDEPHPNPEAVYVIRGAGSKSFCSGGNIISIAHGDSVKRIQEWTYLQTQLNLHLKTKARTTQVSLLNGYVMGGGAGLAVAGQYRVATEKADFAMPECKIGMFPDVGASWFLPRIPIKGLGLYMGLTSSRIKGADLVHAGLATHFVPGSSIDKLEEELCNIADPSTVADCLSAHASKDLPAFSLEKHMPLIERVFALKPDTTVEGILEGLKSDGSEFAKKGSSILQRQSPTSLKLTLEMQKRSMRMTDLADAFDMEYGVAQRVMDENDFKEGVRALLKDKTNDPKWNPASIEGVSDEYVRSFFGPFPGSSGIRHFHPTNPF